MSGSRRAHLAILLTLVLGYNVASSQLLDFYANEIIIQPDETVECDSLLECLPKPSCNKGRMCMWLNNKLVQYATITCDTETDTPYCNNGTCSKTPRPDCVKGGESSQFVCPMTNGTYPDPSNCAIYHMCANRFATTNVCARNNVYDHESGGCKYVRFITNANCVTINCIKKEGQSFVYPRDDRIYGKCLLGKPYILGRCKNYERYDLVENKCVRQCRATGVQPPYNPEECGKYVYCAEVSPKKYEPVEMLCACNEGYDEKANSCTQDAECLKNITEPCKKQEENSAGGGNGDSGEQPKNKDNDGTNVNTDQVSPLIINNSGNNNDNNNVANGDDNVNGNLVNGNNNGDNSDSGNVASRTSSSSQIINNSGNNNNENNVSNGDDKINGNLVNGNNNGNNNNSGNVANGDPVPSPLIINNSGNNNGNNNITNGNDNVNGNLVNGNNNGDNRESGNVQRRNAPTIDKYIINNSGNDNNKNDVSNGDDSVDGNIVNGNDNGDNVNSGNVKNEDPDVPQLPPIINDSVENDNGNNDEVSNGADGNATDEDGNDNNNANSDNVDTSQPIENPRNRKIFNFLRIIFDWVIRITIGEPPVN